MSATKEYLHDEIEKGMRPVNLSKIEFKIFRLKDDIRILKEHLHHETHPDKYCLKKSPTERQAEIKFMQARLEAKISKLEKLEKRGTHYDSKRNSREN